MKFLIAVILGGIMTGLLFTIDKWFPIADRFLKKHLGIETTVRCLFFVSLFYFLTMFFYSIIINLK